MSKISENYAWSQIRPQFKSDEQKVIAAKVKAVISAYPEWANAQKSTEQPPTTQDSSIKAAPTSLPGYAEKRAAAAKKAQTSMNQPAATPSVNLSAFGKQTVTPSTLPLAKPAPNVAPRMPNMRELIRQRQARGMTEGKFTDLYNLLESALYEQNNEQGAFSDYLTQVVQLDINDPQYANTIAKIDNLFNSNKSDDAYKLASKLLTVYYTKKNTRSSGISRGVSTSNIAGATTDRIVQNIKSGALTQEDLKTVLMQSLLRLKNKHPDEYNTLVRDIKGSLSNYISQSSAKE